MTPPLKWHGGKHYLASKIVALMPTHTHYVEAYAGGLAVLLAKSPVGVSEVANDINHRLTNFWSTLQDPDLFQRFRRFVEAVPFSEREWEKHANGSCRENAVDDAIAFFISCRQSLAGRMECFAPLSRTRTRRGMNEQASAWLNAVEGLLEVHSRLKRVAILNREAIDVIRQQDGPDTLFYLDPPYLSETRASKEVYKHEMDDVAHARLLATINECKGKVMLSGYESAMYSRSLRKWNRHDFKVPNQAAGGKTKRQMVESLWCNF